MGDVFLNREEQDAIQKLYSTFLSDVKPDRILPYLYSEQVINQVEKQNIDAERTDWSKNDKIYEVVLARASYPNVCAMRQALLQTRDGKHAHIADMLPKRRTYAEPQTTEIRDGVGLNFFPPQNVMDDYVPPPREYQYQEVSQPAARSDRHQQFNHHQQETQPPSVKVNISRTTSDPYHNMVRSRNYQRPPPIQGIRHRSLDDHPPQAYLSGAYPQPVSFGSNLSLGAHPYLFPAQGHNSLNVTAGGHMNPVNYHTGSYGSSENVPQPNSPTYGYDRGSVLRNDHRPQSANENQYVNQSLACYMPKQKNKKSGKGLCVIFTNFTEDLIGYKKDRIQIEHFFGETLGYQVLGGENNDNVHNFENLTRFKFMEALDTVQTHVNGPFSDIDRLVVFVLSHGDERGIKTCAEGSGREEEQDAKGDCIYIKPEEIVEKFTHDKVSKLNGMPKCFFLQHCRGQATTRAAVCPTRNELASRAASEAYPPLKAVGADTAIFYATNPNCQSYVVDEKGSWFISETIKHMKELHDKEHLVDIMTGVNGQLCKKFSSNVNGENRGLAFQMPHIASNLTSKFYLTIPNHQ